jgi:hypothetical protein
MHFNSSSVLLALAVSLFPAFSTQVLGQTLNRNVEVEPQHRNDAVAVTRVTLGNAVLACGIPDSLVSPPEVTPVAAGPNWLMELTIYALNRTNKSIVYSELMLSFPETGNGKTPQTPQTGVPLRLGAYPAAVAYLGSGQQMQQPVRPSLDWQPGQTLAITINAEAYAAIRRSLANRLPDPSQVTQLLIRRGPVVFDDNMRWTIGSFSVPDLEKPGRWKLVSDLRFFPGKLSWPLVFDANATPIQMQPTAK